MSININKAENIKEEFNRIYLKFLIWVFVQTRCKNVSPINSYMDYIIMKKVLFGFVQAPNDQSSQEEDHRPESPD